MPYDDNNVFAKILRGDIPSSKVYEDDDTLVFMDVMPQAPGHTLVVPKAPSRNLLDADPAVLAKLAPIVQLTARAVKEAFKADGVTVVQFNEAGQRADGFPSALPRHPAPRGRAADAAQSQHGEAGGSRRPRRANSHGLEGLDPPTITDLRPRDGRAGGPSAAVPQGRPRRARQRRRRTMPSDR